MVFVFVCASARFLFCRPGKTLSLRHSGGSRTAKAGCRSERRRRPEGQAQERPVIHLLLFLASMRKPTHVRVLFRPPSWRPGHFSCLPKRSNQEKGTRVGRRRYAPVRCGRPGFCRQAIHGLRQKRRDPSRRPARGAGLIRPPFAAPHGPTSKASQAKSRAKALGPGFRRDDDLGEFLDSSFKISAWLLRPRRPRSVPTGFPLGRGEGAEEKARRGARTMRARSLSGQGRPVSEPPERPREVAGQEARRPRPRGCVLFGYFLLHKQEKVTPSQGCEGSSQGRESVLVTAPKSKTEANGFRLPPE